MAAASLSGPSSVDETVTRYVPLLLQGIRPWISTLPVERSLRASMAGGRWSGGTSDLLDPWGFRTGHTWVGRHRQARIRAGQCRQPGRVSARSVLLQALPPANRR